MRRPVRIFFVLVFAATWGLGLVGLIVPHAFPGTPLFSNASPFYWLAGYAISVIGIAMTAVYEGRPGLHRLFSRLRPWRARWYWYLIVLGGYGLITFAALEAARWFGVGPASMPGPRALIVGAGLTLVTDVGPLGEEFGWRGFALPRLLERQSPFQASMVLGAIHGVWHLPLFFIPTLAQSHVAFPIFFIGVLAIAVIDTWLYLRSEANLLLAILVHLMSNYGGGLLGVPGFPFFIAAEATAAMVIVVFGGLRPR